MPGSVRGGKALATFSDYDGPMRQAASVSNKAGIVIALAALLAACGERAAAPDDLAQLDRDLAAAAIGAVPDPAIVAALEEPIMVDPALVGQANADAVRPPPRPYSAAVPLDALAGKPVPVGPTRPAPAATGDCPDCRAARGALTLGELALRQRDAAIRGCADRIGYSATWSTRLPAALPLYPDARVSEAAGADAAGCALRLVSFATAAAARPVIDWYHARATDAGYSATHRADAAMHVLDGTRRDGAAYRLYLTPRPGGGTRVDLIVNRGG